ncbi:hypothetical protein HF325_004739 [Metschnikowia pulcherrima]|uniref:SET domain-containing protein n=1 Tax=Metschnikowia pulcherrima TaxID=27326 RepID=A0A8H7GNV6_9ASCO|nr:hypothetical protein HF325_004739 [Metschnikowia pulcherrima]
MTIAELEGFLQWASSRGIELQSAEVRTSILGGLGLFANNTIEKHNVILRVPKKNVIDLDSLLQITEKLKADDKTDTVAAILSAALRAGGQISETMIIRNFMWGFCMLLKNGTFLKDDVSVIDGYLRVLLTTPTMDIDEQDNDPDLLIQQSIEEKNSVRKNYSKLIEDYPAAESLLSFQEAFQLHQAVKSRVLEIPHAETSLEEYDYSTNISLVPMLDFMNHSHENNAVFDVDESTNDVILRVVKNIDSGEEITISYDPVDSVNSFLRTYGFIPEKPSEFTWTIPDLNSLLREWLQIRPEVHLDLDSSGTVGLRTEFSRLPFLLIPGLSYYDAWAPELKSFLCGASKATEAEVDEIVEEIRIEEESEPVILGFDTVFGVMWHDQHISYADIREQTGLESEHGIRMLATRTFDFVRRALRPDQLVAPNRETSHAKEGPINEYKKLREVCFKKISDLSDDKLWPVVEDWVRNL